MTSPRHTSTRRTVTSRASGLTLALVLLAGSGLASAQLIPGSGRSPDLTGQVTSSGPYDGRFALIVNTANDFYGYEHTAAEEDIYQSLPDVYTDRDAFPAQALQAYDVAHNVLGIPDNHILLMRRYR